MNSPVLFAKKSLILLSVSLLLAPVATIGQDENQPFFSLMSERTFAPGEKAVINLSATEIGQSLEFRVYKVKDVTAFFQKMEDPHMFGGAGALEPQEKVPLESFHKWKVGWRTRLRDSVRAQFTRDSRAVVHAWQAGSSDKVNGSKQGPITQFAADAPVLNPQQLVATWTQRLTPKKNKWETQAVPVPVTTAGVYMVEATHRELRAYTVVIVSDLAMVTKTAPGRLVAFVVDRKSGEPAPGVPVTLWAAKKEGRTAETNRDGLVDTKVAGLKADQLMVLAKRGESVAVQSLYSGGLEVDPSRMTLAYIYTDRPVYRPGHEVHFKMLMRTRTALGYGLPPGGDADVEITNSEGNTVFQKRLAVSSMGSVAGSYTLPGDAGLGYYSINVKQGEQRGQAGFQVEEYKKPEYEVRVTPEKQRVVQGEPIKAVIDAKYYYGEPVPNAKVTYVVHKSHYWLPRFYDSDEPDDSDTQDDYAGQQADEQQGKLDADGKLTVTIPTELSEHRYDTRYRIEARVMDAGNREIAGATAVVATVGDFVIQASPDKYAVAPGESVPVTVQMRSYTDEPVQGSVRVTLWSWDYKEKSQGHAIGETVESQADAQGIAKLTLKAAGAGSYRILAEAKGPGTRAVQDTAYLWVSGISEVWGDGEQQVTLVPDKKSYKAGETAHILVVTGVPQARVLFTTESQGIDLLQVVRASGPTVTVDVPIKAENVPELYVSAAFVHDGQMHNGTKRVKVPPVAQKMDVTLTPSKPQYKPGEAAQFVLTAKDGNGQPVAGGEFSVGVVDEAIYAIRRDSTPDIVSFFYGRIENMVATDNSLNYFFTGEAGKRRMMLTKAPHATALAQLKPERLVEPKIRKAFPDTALWTPTVVTDSAGHAVANLTFPDSLTTWRATARGITADAKVGNTTSKTIVRKDLLISLAIPRFFTEGDEVVIGAMVRNYLPREKQARVSLEVKGLEVIDGGTKDVTVPSKGEGRVQWRVRALAGSRTATLLAKAKTDEESDGVEMPLPVNPQGVKMTRAKAGSLAGSNDEIEIALDVPPQMVAGSRKLTIEIAPSVAGTLFGAMEYLTSFPYGCTEQTMSSFLPNIVVARALREAGTKSNVDRLVLQQKITAGLERLYEYQHEDGGWGWWKTDDSQIFLTSYVLAGLAQARDTGQDIKPEAIDNGKKWLQAALDKQPNLLVDLRAYATYALTLNEEKEPVRLQYIWDHQDRLSPYGSVLFGLALDQAGDKRAAEVAKRVESQLVVEGDEASLPSKRDSLMDLEESTTSEASAQALKLLVKLAPKSPAVEKLALWLMNHRNEGSYWSTTKQTAMVIYGLTDYLKSTGELHPDFTGKIVVDGKNQLSKEFQPEDALAPNAPKFEMYGVNGPVKVKVTRSGKGRLYYSVREEYYASGEKLTATGSTALGIWREYYKLSANKTPDKVTYDLQPIDGSLQPGDTLAVRLSLRGDKWSYLMVEDPIPAGTELIERDDLYELTTKPDWWGRYAMRREFHDDRVALFETFFSTKREYVYLLKVVNPGKFRISPARVQPMYQPRFFATTESRTLEVKE